MRSAWLDPVDEPLGNGAVVCLTAGQYDGDETAFSICECMNLRVSPARERPTACFCSPLFRPMPSGVL
jgi:hypothetical protein